MEKKRKKTLLQDLSHIDLADGSILYADDGWWVQSYEDDGGSLLGKVGNETDAVDLCRRLNCADPRPVIEFVSDGNDAIEFLSRFPLWAVERLSSGVTRLTIKDDCGDCTSVDSRRSETFVQLVERARRQLIIAGGIEC